MSEDFNVTQAGYFGMSHRSLSIKRCANGYIVNYHRVRKVEEKHYDHESSSVEEKRVFINNSDMIEFVKKYYDDEPNP